MSIQSEAERIKANVAATYAAAAGLGAEMPDAQNSNNLSKTVAGAKAVLYAPQELTAEQQAQARNNIGAASADTVSQLSQEKVDKQQGVSNAGKLLYVANDGTVMHLTLGAGLNIVNGILTITNTAVAVAICGEAICGNVICGGTN